MNEESTFSVRRNKKVAGIEDPIVIIQRLLNIFRQRHILDEKQKLDFDNMILQQPPEIRHMCSVLPGGSLLQEYIDELEEKNGITPNQNLEHPESNTILASALAANSAKKEDISVAPQVQPTQNIAVDKQTLELQRQMLQMMQKMQSQVNNAPVSSAGITTIKTDASFAKDLGTAIADALNASDEKRHKEFYALAQAMIKSQQESTSSIIKEFCNNDNTSHAVTTISDGDVKVIDNTKEITKAITESQLEMAKMFLQHNAINANNNNANNANNIQINNVPFSNTQDLIGDIIKAQSQLFREMAKEQTKEISSIISGALKESSQLSNEYLVKALSEFQKENLNFLKQQVTQKNMYYQYLPNVSGDDISSTPVIHEAEDNNKGLGIKRVFSNMFNLSQSPKKDTDDFSSSEKAESPAVSDINLVDESGDGPEFETIDFSETPSESNLDEQVLTSDNTTEE